MVYTAWARLKAGRVISVKSTWQLTKQKSDQSFLFRISVLSTRPVPQIKNFLKNQKSSRCHCFTGMLLHQSQLPPHRRSSDWPIAVPEPEAGFQKKWSCETLWLSQIDGPIWRNTCFLYNSSWEKLPTSTGFHSFFNHHNNRSCSLISIFSTSRAPTKYK